MWRLSANTRRCIVPVNGFYEWSKWDGQPWFFQRAKGEQHGIVGLAGIWEPGERPHHADVYAILTTSPNELMKPIHNRMPVILPSANWHEWMSEKPYSEVEHLVKTPAEDVLTYHTVSRRINIKDVDEPSLMDPVKVHSQGALFGDG